MILKPFLFLDENDTTGESNPLNVMGADQLTISVEASGAVDLTVYGKLDNQSTEWHELGGISLIDYESASPIDSTGVYTFIVSGLTAVKIVNNGTAGNCKVFGNLCNAESGGAW